MNARENRLYEMKALHTQAVRDIDNSRKEIAVAQESLRQNLDRANRLYREIIAHEAADNRIRNRLMDELKATLVREVCNEH
jgi:hypothetical protein